MAGLQEHSLSSSASSAASSAASSHASPGRADVGRVPYLPGLDGLRAIAVVAVMIYHADHSWLGGGFLGVEVFFVISGYLITLLLVGEHERTGRIALGQFWLRRFRRLLPALFVMMSALAVYMALFHRRPQGQTRGDFLGGIFYVSNWYQIVVGQGYTAAEAFAPLRHLWSLAVEEQFYLLWPLVMILLLRRGASNLPRLGLWLFGVSITIALITAVLYAGGDVATTCAPGRMHGYWELGDRCISTNETLYLSTITRAGGLMLGAAFAMVWRPAAILRGPMRDRARRVDLLAGAGVAVLILLFWRLWLTEPGQDLGIRFDPWLFRGGFFVTGVATLLVIAAASHQRAATGTLLGNPLFLWIGTRSYGLYLYHWPIYQIIREQAGIALSLWEFVLAMAITVPITELSYRYVEVPIRQGRLSEIYGRARVAMRRDRDERRNLTIVLVALTFLVGTAAVSFATAENLCVGDVACSLERGPDGDAGPSPTLTTIAASDITDPNTSPSAAPDSSVADGPVDTSGGTVATTLPPTTTTVDLDAIPPIAVGDSVMAGAEGQLRAAGFNVSAQESRQGLDVVTELQNLRANNLLGRTAVIQIGTNGTVSDETLDQIMASMPADLTPTVVFLTVRGTGLAWIDGNNERIRALPTRYPHVRVVDWATAADSIQLCPDGAHITCSGSGPINAYTALIFEAIGRRDLIPSTSLPAG